MRRYNIRYCGFRLEQRAPSGNRAAITHRFTAIGFSVRERLNPRKFLGHFASVTKIARGGAARDDLDLH